MQECLSPAKDKEACAHGLSEADIVQSLLIIPGLNLRSKPGKCHHYTSPEGLLRWST